VIPAGEIQREAKKIDYLVEDQQIASDYFKDEDIKDDYDDYDDYFKVLNCEYDCVTQFCTNDDDDLCDKKCKQLCGEVF